MLLHQTLVFFLMMTSIESRVVKRSAQFFNDASTTVGQQIGPASAFNNEPGANIGSTSTGGSPIPTNNENSNTEQQIGQGQYLDNQPGGNFNSMATEGTDGAAIFVNDGNTFVGEQVGPEEYFENQPGATIGSTSTGSNLGSATGGTNGAAIFVNDANTFVGQQVGQEDFFENQPGATIGTQTNGFESGLPSSGGQNNPQMTMTTVDGITTMTMIQPNGEVMTMQVPSSNQATIGTQMNGFGSGLPSSGGQSNQQITTVDGITTMTMIQPNGDVLTMQVPSSNQGAQNNVGPQRKMTMNNGASGSQILSQVILPDSSINSPLGSITTNNGVTTMTMNGMTMSFPAANNNPSSQNPKKRNFFNVNKQIGTQIAGR